MLQFKTHLKSI